MQSHLRKVCPEALRTLAKTRALVASYSARTAAARVAVVAPANSARMFSAWTLAERSSAMQMRAEVMRKQPQQLLRAAFSSYPPHEVVGLPSLSPTMETGTISSWNKKVGDKFVPGDVICAVETDKATVDFEAQDEGFVAKILVEAQGGEVKVGEPIMVTVDDEGSIGAFANFTVPSGGAAAAAPKAASTPAPTPTPAAQTSTSAPAQPAFATTSATSSSGRVFISPLAKRLAEEKGINIATLTGTGPRGRVIAADVREASPATQAAAAAAAPFAQAAQTQAQRPISIGGVYEDFVLDDASRQLADRLTAAKQTVPHYHLSVDLNLDGLLQVREKLNKGLPTEDQISVQDIIAKAAAAAMRQVPDVNSSWMDSFVRRYDQVDINMVVGSGNETTVPVIRDVGAIGLKQLAQRRRQLETAAFEGKLDEDSLKIGTFSIVNLGMYGVKSAATVVLTPQACALALGAAELRVIPRTNPAEGEEPYQYSTMMTVTLACDHRVVDGAVGAQWLSAFKVLVEDPISILM